MSVSRPQYCSLLQTCRSSNASSSNARRAFSTSRRVEKEKMVICGSGWAGYNVLRKIDKRRYDVTLVSPNTYFAFTPLLASCAVGTLEFRCALEPVRRYSPPATFFQAWADEIDFTRRKIQCSAATPPIGSAKGQRDPLVTDRGVSGDKFELQFDKLVLAVGSYSQTFGIEGVKEHAYFLKDVKDARAIRIRVLECFEQASQPTLTDMDRRRLLNFVIVGGGPTGIEFAAELHDLCATDIAKHYPTLAPLIQITVYETSATILGAFDETLQAYAAQRFAREGITIKSNHRVLRVNATTIEVDGEGEVPFGLCVWSTGLAPNPLVNSCNGLKKDPRTKSLVTNERLEALDLDGQVVKNVWAIGDAATIDGQALPATAQVASQKAVYTAKCLNALVRDRSFGQPFVFQSRGNLAYIGGWTAIYDRSKAESGPKPKEAG